MSIHKDDDDINREYLDKISYFESIENLLVLSHVLNANYSKLSIESLN